MTRGEGKAEIELIKHASMMELSVSIDANVEVECDRCLDLFTLPISFEDDVVVKISDLDGEDDGDVIWIHPWDDRLDLAPYIYESIILSLPYQRTHQTLEQCNQDMVSRFSIVSEQEFEELEQQIESEPIAAKIEEISKNPFAKLADIKE